MLTMAISGVEIMEDRAYVLMYSPDGTNVDGSRDEEFEGMWLV